MNFQVRLRIGGAEQGFTSSCFIAAERRRKVVLIADFTANELTHAAATGATATTIGNADALAQGGVDDGFAFIDCDLEAVGLNSNGITHANSLWPDRQKLGKRCFIRVSHPKG